MHPLSSRVLCVCGVILLPLLPSCSAQNKPASSFDSNRAFSELEDFLAIGPRVPGTEGSITAQNFIKKSDLKIIYKELLIYL